MRRVRHPDVCGAVRIGNGGRQSRIAIAHGLRLCPPLCVDCREFARILIPVALACRVLCASSRSIHGVLESVL